MDTPLIAKVDRLLGPLPGSLAKLLETLASCPGLDAAYFLEPVDGKRGIVSAWIWRGTDGLLAGREHIERATGRQRPLFYEERIYSVIGTFGEVSADTGLTAGMVHIGPSVDDTAHRAEIDFGNRVAWPTLTAHGGFANGYFVEDPAGRGLMALGVWSTPPVGTELEEAIQARGVSAGFDMKARAPVHIEQYRISGVARPRLVTAGA